MECALSEPVNLVSFGCRKQKSTDCHEARQPADFIRYGYTDLNQLAAKQRPSAYQSSFFSLKNVILQVGHPSAMVSPRWKP